MKHILLQTLKPFDPSLNKDDPEFQRKALLLTGLIFGLMVTLYALTFLFMSGYLVDSAFNNAIIQLSALVYTFLFLASRTRYSLIVGAFWMLYLGVACFISGVMAGSALSALSTMYFSSLVIVASAALLNLRITLIIAVLVLVGQFYLSFTSPFLNPKDVFGPTILLFYWA